MIVRGLDGNHDWLYGKGRNDYRSNQAAVVQNINTRLSSFLNDCFFATDQGLDWFNLLGAKNELAIDLAVSVCILNTVDVTGLLQLQILLNPNSRNILIRYRVQTTYSQGVLGQFTFDFGDNNA